MSKFYFFPKTKVGKVAFWIVLLSLAGIYLQYWISLEYGSSIPPFFGLLYGGLLVICGVTSLLTIIKHKDYAILLVFSTVVGFLGVFFMIGEILFIN